MKKITRLWKKRNKKCICRYYRDKKSNISKEDYFKYLV